MGIHFVEKKEGETPKEALDEFRLKNPERTEEKITYIGRLDPMASGTLLFLSGDDRFHAKEYQSWQKTYRATFMLGFSSDTGDTLGIIRAAQKQSYSSQILTRAMQSLVGEHVLPLPAYSAYKVRGKPLCLHAREGTLTKEDIPTRTMQVIRAEQAETFTQKRESLRKDVHERIARVKGDFRQEAILQSWDSALREGESDILLGSITLRVASGVYFDRYAKFLTSI